MCGIQQSYPDVQHPRTGPLTSPAHKTHAKQVRLVVIFLGSSHRNSSSPSRSLRFPFGEVVGLKISFQKLLFRQKALAKNVRTFITL